jgi:hypothetical protein
MPKRLHENRAAGSRAPIQVSDARDFSRLLRVDERSDEQ